VIDNGETTLPAGLFVGGGEGVFELLVGLLWQLNNDMFKLGVGVGDA
jgi:hypothetical protein